MSIEVFTPEEAADILKVRPSWLKEQARLRKVRHLLIGGRIAFTREHLTEIVAASERVPEDAPVSTGPRRRPAPTADGVVPVLRARRPRRQRAP